MRKALVFVAAFALVLVAGAAVALIGTPENDAGDEKPQAVEEPDEASSEFHEKEDPPAEDAKEEEHEEEPPKEEPKEEPDEEPKEEPKEEEEKDTDPPDLVILYPEDGQHFEKKEVVFEGKTEPGARVFAGKYEADVDSKGNWRIVLFLTHDGANNASFHAKDEAGNTSEASIKVYYEGHDEEPKEEPKEIEIGVKQKYGSCAEEVPYDKFLVWGPAGTKFEIYNEYGYASKTLPEDGEYWIRVEFPDMPCGEHGIIVKVNGEFFEDYGFVHVCEEEGGGEEGGHDE